MKRKILILCAFLWVLSCGQRKSEKTNSTEETVTSEELLTSEETVTVTNSPQSFDWLLGHWQREDETEGKETFETWNKISPGEYSGFGFTLQKSDTVWQEKMSLIENNGAWALYIQAPEDPEPVIFKMTSSDDQSFICENPELDFPKKIKYKKGKNGILASVSNEELEIPFEFSSIE